MGITPHPAQYPDIVMYEHALPISWRVYIRSNGVPVDLTGDEVLVPVSARRSNSSFMPRKVLRVNRARLVLRASRAIRASRAFRASRVRRERRRSPT
jgi:hypothetical protein